MMAFKAFSAVAGALADFWLRMLHVFRVSDSDTLETLGFTNISGAAGVLWLHAFKVSDSDTLETLVLLTFPDQRQGRSGCMFSRCLIQTP